MSNAETDQEKNNHNLSEKEKKDKKLMAALADYRARRGNLPNQQEDGKRQALQIARIAGNSATTSQTVFNKTNQNLQRVNQYDI